MRWWVSVLGSAVITGSAVVINLATEWKHTLWAWLLVAGLALAGAGVTVWSSRLDRFDQGSSNLVEPDGVTASGARAVAAGGNILVTITGDHPDPAALARPVQSQGTPLTAPPPGSNAVQAVGPRSVAAGGDIDFAVTGDRPPRQKEHG